MSRRSPSSSSSGKSQCSSSSRLAEKMSEQAAQDSRPMAGEFRKEPISCLEEVALIRGTSVKGSANARTTCGQGQDLRVAEVHLSHQ